MTTETTNARPSHRVYAVTKNGEKSFRQAIGALWVHADGKGFNQKLDYLPLNGAKIIVREIRDEPETDGNGGAL